MEAGEEQDESVKHYYQEEVAPYMIRRVEDFSWAFRTGNDNLKFGHQKGQHHGRKGC